MTRLVAIVAAMAAFLSMGCKGSEALPVDASLVCATPGQGLAHYDYIAGSGVSSPEEAVRDWVERRNKNNNVRFTRTSVEDYAVGFAIHTVEKKVLERITVTSQVSKVGPFERTRWVVGGSSKCA